MGRIKINPNERSWGINLISIINQFTNRHDLIIDNAGGEFTILSGKQRMFPDVILYGDRSQTVFLQGWELKMPDTLITDSEFINDAQRKARNLGLNSTVIWNFTAAILYVFDCEKWHVKKAWNETNHIKTREDVIKYQDDWEKLIEEVVLQVNQFLITGEIIGQKIDKVVTDSLMANVIENNKENVGKKLKEDSNSNRVVEAYIKHWWQIAKTEYLNDETDPFVAYSKMLILNWLNKFLFAHMIKNYQVAARVVDTISETEDIKNVSEIFEEITKKCDFYGIFCAVKFHDLLDDETWSELLEYNTLLKSINLDTVDQKIIQEILEHSVASSKRLIKGQYTTPKVLSEILCDISMLNVEAPFLDCCCGTGTIAKAGLNIKKARIGLNEALNTTWASDVDNFTLQLATIAMSSVETINKPILIFNENAFNLKEENIIDIISPENGKVLKYELPKMETICANLPFIAFERLEDDVNKDVERIIEKVKNETGVKLSKRGDVYTYFPFTLHDLLNSNGRMGVITSNSWLGTKSGKLFYEALRKYYHIRQLHISGNKKWFNNADVITVMLILEKKQINQLDDHKNTSFFVWKKSLMELDENKTYKDNLIHSSILDINPNTEVSTKVTYTLEEQKEILKYNVSLNSLFHDISWLLETKDKIIPIINVFEVFRGSRRGWDALFYPKGPHSIEGKYIKKVLINARKVSYLETKAVDDVFCCSKTKSELINNKDYGALSWIEKFENEVNNIGKPLPEVLAKKGIHWYEITTSEMADFFTMMNPDRRLFFGKFVDRSFINQRLIGLRLKEGDYDKSLLHALLNSILSIFYIEAVGFGRGLGALDINKENIGSIYMLNPNLLSKKQKIKIKTLFQPILDRQIWDYEQEIEMADRTVFDNYVLDCFGLENIYSDIKRTFLSMHKIRHDI